MRFVALATSKPFTASQAAQVRLLCRYRHKIRTQEAFDLLLPAVKRFPRETTIPYNLACYTSQLGDLSTARQWFERVLTLGPKPAEKVHRLQCALADSDLKPPWPELRQRLENLQAGSES